ncbi:MAG: S-layer homology domain-containing protein [Clostridia bacterium]|nr:S-layer homology domain-containing protein [Clostridia bacterium]
MKRVVSLFLILIVVLQGLTFANVPADIPVPELKGMDMGNAESTEIDAYDKGFASYVNSYYLDAQKMTYSRDIARMGALGIIKKEDSMNYNPDAMVTKQQLIESLVRLNGNEAQVLQNVSAQAAGMNQATYDRMLKQAYVDQAVASGIVTANEVIALNTPVTKEQTALWVAKLIGLQETFQDQNNLYAFGDWQNINPSSRGYIETLVSNRIMDVDNDGNFNPNREITKGEMAYILNNASVELYDALNITSNFGLVIGRKDDQLQESTYTVNEQRYVVRNMDGTLTTFVSRQNSKTKARNEFVLLDDNIVKLSQNLQAGDQIEYLVRDNQVVYVEVYTDGSIKEQIKRENENNENTTIYYGYINQKISEEKWEGGKYLSIDRMRTTIYNGLVFDIVVEEDLNTGVKNDIIVYKDNTIGGISLLETGDVVEILVQDETNIIYVKVSDPTSGQVSGTVRYVDTDFETGVTMLTIFDYDNQIKKYEVASYASVEINHELAEISDLKYGQDVMLSITNGYVTKISGETFLNPGFIPDYSKMRTGKVSYVTTLGDVVVKYDNGKSDTIEIPDTTTIIKGGNIISAQAMQEGDAIKIYFNDIYSNEASLIEVEGKEQLIQNLYRGLVQDVNLYRNELTIIEPAVLNNAQWKNDETAYAKTFTIGDDVGIYVRGQQIDLETLSKLYRQKPVYLAVKDDYSQEAVVQVSVAIGGEHFSVDRVEDIDKVVGNMELQDNNSNIVFNEGTIFLKNSKIVDASNIDQWDDVIVVSDYYKGQDNANIIRITSDAERIFDNIHIGALEDVYGYTFTLRNYATISGNQWSDVNRSTSSMFFYFNELDIVDITNKLDFKTLSSYEFYHGGYSREENLNETSAGLDYYRYYTYFVTDEDRKVIGMNIRHYGLLDGQNIDMFTTDENTIKTTLDERLQAMVLTRGTVVSKDETWNRLEITDSHDWAEDFGRWNANRGNSSVEYRDAIFVKNNHRITIDDINPGDYIYVLRDDEDALVIFVEVR